TKKSGLGNQPMPKIANPVLLYEYNVPEVWKVTASRAEKVPPSTPSPSPSTCKSNERRRNRQTLRPRGEIFSLVWSRATRPRPHKAVTDWALPRGGSDVPGCLGGPNALAWRTVPAPPRRGEGGIWARRQRIS